jgi:hypothetical protein
MISCAACVAPLRPRARFCGKCGAAVEAKATENVLYVLPASHRGTLGSLVGRSEAALWVDSASALQQVQAAVADRHQAGIDAICLVGDQTALPFGRLPDPTGYDEVILTDSLYGMPRTPSEEERMSGDLLPEVPVSRIPSLDPALVQRLLRVGDGLCPDWRSGVAVSAAVWSHASSEVLRQLGAEVTLQLSPPRQRDEVERELAAAPGRVYFNVHGTDQDAVWLGEGDGHYPEVLRPAGVRAADNALVFSEACYGATLADGAGSIAPSFLAAGAGGFVGSTIIAWGGGPGSPPCLADQIAIHVFRLASQGMPLGQALQGARLALMETALVEDGVLDVALHNTLLSFVAYGAPSARARSTGLAPPVGGKSVLQQTRERLRRRLAPGAWQILSSGRVTMRELAAAFGQGPTVARRLEELLGSGPQEAHVTRYQAGARQRATITARATVGRWRRYAGVRVDPDGRVLQSFVGR